jgi:hypothetical protein
VASEINELLRTEVARRADYRCEYCLIHEDDAGFPHQVDHALSRKHGGSSELDNLAYACVLCNRRKGTDVASVETQTGKVVRLFNPRQDRWSDHFEIDGEFIEPRTPIGGVTARLLRLNTAERIVERRILQALGRYPLR